MPITVSIPGERTSAGRFGAIDAGQKRCPQALQRERDAMAIAIVIGKINNNTAAIKPKYGENKNPGTGELIPKQLIIKDIIVSTVKIRNAKNILTQILSNRLPALPPH
jgi:hypothetical protein